MNKFLQRLFLFEKCEIQTKLSKQQILNRVKAFINSECTDYYGSVSEHGFFIGEKNIKHFIGGHSHNSFAPIAKAKIIEKDGITTVSIKTRMNLLTLILFAPIYVISLITVVLFPLMLMLLHSAFIIPAERLKQSIEDLIIEN